MKAANKGCIVKLGSIPLGNSESLYKACISELSQGSKEAEVPMNPCQSLVEGCLKEVLITQHFGLSCTKAEALE